MRKTTQPRRKTVPRVPRAGAIVLVIGLVASACAATLPPPRSAPAIAAGELAAEPRKSVIGSTNGAAPETEEDAGDEGEEKRNKIALFLGGTHKADEGAGSAGIEYERRLSDAVGAGLLLESTPSLRELVLAPALFIHPVGDLGVLFAPGFETEDGETLWLVRVGVSWDFELGRGFTLAPEINFDLVEGSDNAFVYGIALGYEF